MVEVLPSPMRPLGDTLVLVFNKGEAIRAEDLGSLFSDLAKDYRGFTGGRTLVVDKLESGSLIAYLRDAVEAVKPYLTGIDEWVNAGSALLDFSKRLKEVISDAKESPEKSRVLKRAESLLPSVQSSQFSV